MQSITFMMKEPCAGKGCGGGKKTLNRTYLNEYEVKTQNLNGGKWDENTVMHLVRIPTIKLSAQFVFD